MACIYTLSIIIDVVFVDTECLGENNLGSYFWFWKIHHLRVSIWHKLVVIENYRSRTDARRTCASIFRHHGMYIYPVQPIRCCIRRYKVPGWKYSMVIFLRFIILNPRWRKPSPNGIYDHWTTSILQYLGLSRESCKSSVTVGQSVQNRSLIPQSSLAGTQSGFISSIW